MLLIDFSASYIHPYLKLRFVQLSFKLRSENLQREKTSTPKSSDLLYCLKVTEIAIQIQKIYNAAWSVPGVEGTALIKHLARPRIL